MIINMPNKEGVTLATKGKYCAENIKVVPAFKTENVFAEYVQGTKTEITADDLNGAISIRENAFSNSSVTSITISDSVISIGEQAFINCKSLSTVIMTDSVVNIGRIAFRNCSSLTSITLPKGITVLDYQLFYLCTSLSSMVIPMGVTSIGTAVFFGCSSLASVTIPDSVTIINNEAFRGCKNLTSIKIPNSVTTISNLAFEGCTNLKEFICLADNPPTLGGNTFNNVPTDCIFKVLPQSVESYKSETNWSARGDNIIALTPEEVLQYGG